ncbi:PDZ domain-containing protein [Accumulibacter sp.]|uniref:PDZ domain-containing protein n=1 Tax=Accumulibacter sp. TaxID=2053492 RepID=UPI002586C908|nr:PDZ domain-containing protein [Accumulibacter sp.]
MACGRASSFRRHCPLEQGSRRPLLLVENASGPAARAGIRRGDIVLALNGQPVRDVAQLRALLDKSGRSVALLIERDNARIFVPVDRYRLMLAQGCCDCCAKVRLDVMPRSQCG